MEVMESEISLPKLQSDLYDTLKSWHKAGVEVSDLQYLQIFPQASLWEIRNARQVINEVKIALNLSSIYFHSAKRLTECGGPTAKAVRAFPSEQVWIELSPHALSIEGAVVISASPWYFIAYQGEAESS